MANQPQNPGSTSGAREQRGRDQEKSKGGTQQSKDAGQVPRSTDDVLDEASEEGTREDAAGRKSGNTPRQNS
jgi:hypothetical protein